MFRDVAIHLSLSLHGAVVVILATLSSAGTLVPGVELTIEWEKQVTGQQAAEAVVLIAEQGNGKLGAGGPTAGRTRSPQEVVEEYLAAANAGDAARELSFLTPETLKRLDTGGDSEPDPTVYVVGKQELDGNMACVHVKVQDDAEPFELRVLLKNTSEGWRIYALAIEDLLWNLERDEYQDLHATRGLRKGQ